MQILRDIRSILLFLEDSKLKAHNFPSDCVTQRFKDYNHKQMMTTLGQKCRDSGRGESNKDGGKSPDK